jgi:2-amino-4-hydroxy-6-hydroxymethyldihydropteridine diphosphokinase
MAIAYLLLGSNLGDRISYIRDSHILIANKAGKVKVFSSLYETASWGKPDQPDFINQVICIDTSLSPDALLGAILSVERELGRKRLEKWGSRTIDIDILLYDDLIVDQPDLKIPHPFMQERRFVLTPLCEIAPDIIHPVFKVPVKNLLKELSDNLPVKIYLSGNK